MVCYHSGLPCGFAPLQTEFLSKTKWWVTKDKFLWQKSCAVSVRSRSLCATHWLHFREILYFFSARSSLGCTCSKFGSFEVLEASDRMIVQQKGLFRENSSYLPHFSFRKKTLKGFKNIVRLWKALKTL